MVEQSSSFTQPEHLCGEPRDQTKPLDEHTLLRMFFWSFYFSQGNKAIQRDLFWYLRLRFNQSNQQIDITEAFYRRARDALESYMINAVGKSHTIAVYKGQSIDKSMIDKEGSWAIESMIKTLRGVDKTYHEPSITSMVERIADGIIYTEHSYLCQRQGRPIERQTVEYEEAAKVRSDSMMSHICCYALEGTITNICDYDNLFSDVRQYVTSEDIGPRSRSLLSQIAVAYLGAHPEKADWYAAQLWYQQVCAKTGGVAREIGYPLG